MCVRHSVYIFPTDTSGNIMLLLGNKILILFGSGYADSGTPLLYIMTISTLFTGTISIYFTILRVLNKIKELSILAVFQAILVIGASVIFIPKFGIIGIGYVWMSTQLLFFFIAWFH